VEQYLFLIPLVVGFLLVIGLAIGGDFDSDGDGIPDIFDPHVPGDHANDATSVLGFGRTPFFLRAAIFSLTLGGVGFCAMLYGHSFLFAVVFGALSASLLTFAAASVIAKYVPTFETKSLKSKDFLGLHGVIVYGLTQDGVSRAHIYHGSDMIAVPVRSVEPLDKGDQIRVIAVDESGVCKVEHRQEGN
jgi:membrane protein implicated in regulation of membrane protease activity